MYYPLQLPHILGKEFPKHIAYSEEVVESLQGFMICLWEMKPLSAEKISVTNIILVDGCIDLLVYYDERKIGYRGMNKTNFNHKINLPGRFFGARLRPGAFEQLTNIPAKRGMEKFQPLKAIDAGFDTDFFFSLEFDECKKYLVAYLRHIVGHKTPNNFVALFNELSAIPPSTAAEFYQTLNYSPRQCQRLFMKHFGITPQAVLSVLRFQFCMDALFSGKATPSDILGLTDFYDQSHFINDFKQNIGLTPFEYLRLFRR